MSEPTGAGWRPAQRYPDPAVEILDPSFAKYRLPLSHVERLGTGFRWGEGPIWLGDARLLLFSDVPNDRIMRWDEATGEISIFRQPSQLRQRQHARPAGPAPHLRAPGPSGHPHRA